MAIIIKTQENIEKMRAAGKILARLDEILHAEIRPGVTTEHLDRIAEDYIRGEGAVPSFLNYNGFPKSICASVNNEIIHGIPSKRKLKAGDILSIDMGAYKDGFHGDCARTYPVGEISEEAARLIEVTKQSFYEGIKYAVAGNHLNEIGAAIQRYVEANGYSVVREYVGHGIGRNVHEDPAVCNYKTTGRGPRLQKGMTLAVEPMVNMGGCGLRVLDDDWTVVTLDGSLSAHYENTLLITDGEPELLTI